MSWQPLGLILLCAANLSLGTIVILHDPNGRKNRLFLLSVLVIVGWISFISLALSPGDLRRTIVLGRFAFAFATAMPCALLWLFLAFKTPDHLGPSRGFKVAAAICLIFVGLSLSPWILSGATQGLTRPDFIYGPLHPLLGIYLV